MSREKSWNGSSPNKIESWFQVIEAISTCSRSVTPILVDAIHPLALVMRKACEDQKEQTEESCQQFPRLKPSVSANAGVTNSKVKDTWTAAQLECPSGKRPSHLEKNKEMRRKSSEHVWRL